jgi:RNA polymerase sigma-70 factor (ECF subfamily)
MCVAPEKKGNSVSFEAIFRSIVDQYSDRVYNHAFRMLGSREEAEEATQEVFVKIWKSMSGFRGEAKLSTWIWRITTNVCISRRSKRADARISLDDLGEDKMLTLAEQGNNPLQHFLQRERRARLEEGIARLPVHEATAITLFYLEGLPYKEIAEIMQVPIGTIATNLHRGRERLREMLNNMEGGSPDDL